MSMNVLVVIDAQNDFIDGVLGSAEAVDVVDNIVHRINKYNGDIIYATMDTHTSKEYYESKEGIELPVIHCEYLTPGWILNDKIFNALKNNVKYEKQIFKKNFWSHELKSEMLKMKSWFNNDDKITLVGYCTDICVMYNAIMLKTLDLKADIVVDASCCAGSTPERHKAALEVMKSCQIKVIGEKNETNN